MTYSLIVPPELLAGLVAIRTATGMSIRMQILEATRDWIHRFEFPCPAENASVSNREVRP